MQYAQKWLDDDQKLMHLSLVGKLQYGQFQDLQKFIFALRDNPPVHITFDLTDVEQIDSSGLGLLLVANDISSGEDKVTVTYPNPQVDQILTVCKMDNVLNVIS